MPENSSKEALHPLPSALIHGLRTPLNQILGYSEMLMEQAQGAENDEFSPDLQKIRAAGRQMLALIDSSFLSIRTPSADAIPTINTSAAQLKTLPTTLREAATSGAAQGFLLVVDDNEANREVLSRRLKLQGYDSATAENGHQALEMLRQNTFDRAFDLVLLDIMMPEMDGYETLQRIKSDPALQHLPVIMISALSELNSVVRCIELGAEDYLPKPFNPTLLKARIGASLEKKRAHDREMQLFEQLQQNFKRLQELEKLRDDLTRMIIHDLRTPLTSVIAGMQMLAMVGDLNPVQHEMMGIAVGGGETLLGMINDLLDVEKLESGTMQLDIAKLSAAKIADAAISQVASLAESKKLILNREIAAGLPPLRGDESKLTRTLVNLLGNALKFTPPGGKVTIEVHHNPQDKTLVFSVIDTGEGIPTEAFDRIFEKFGQVESRQGGRTMSTGLGLTFCKLAVEAHGGHIGVESEPGKGSTFCFSLPLGSPRE